MSSRGKTPEYKEVKDKSQHIRRVARKESSPHMRKYVHFIKFADTAQRLASTYPLAELQRLEKCFLSADHDQDGYLNLVELQYWLEKHGCPVTHLQVIRIMQAADIDCDGKLSFTEFVKFCRTVGLEEFVTEEDEEDTFYDCIDDDESNSEKMENDDGPISEGLPEDLDDLPSVSNNVRYFEKQIRRHERGHRSKSRKTNSEQNERVQEIQQIVKTIAVMKFDLKELCPSLSHPQEEMKSQCPKPQKLPGAPSKPRLPDFLMPTFSQLRPGRYCYVNDGCVVHEPNQTPQLDEIEIPGERRKSSRTPEEVQHLDNNTKRKSSAGRKSEEREILFESDIQGEERRRKSSRKSKGSRKSSEPEAPTVRHESQDSGTVDRRSGEQEQEHQNPQTPEEVQHLEKHAKRKSSAGRESKEPEILLESEIQEEETRRKSSIRKGSRKSSDPEAPSGTYKSQDSGTVDRGSGEQKQEHYNRIGQMLTKGWEEFMQHVENPEQEEEEERRRTRKSEALRKSQNYDAKMPSLPPIPPPPPPPPLPAPITEFAPIEEEEIDDGTHESKRRSSSRSSRGSSDKKSGGSREGSIETKRRSTKDEVKHTRASTLPDFEPGELEEESMDPAFTAVKEHDEAVDFEFVKKDDLPLPMGGIEHIYDDDEQEYKRRSSSRSDRRSSDKNGGSRNGSIETKRRSTKDAVKSHRASYLPDYEPGELEEESVDPAFTDEAVDFEYVRKDDLNLPKKGSVPNDADDYGSQESKRRSSSRSDRNGGSRKGSVETKRMSANADQTMKPTPQSEPLSLAQRLNASLRQFLHVEKLPQSPRHSVPANTDLNHRFHFTNVENLPPPPGHSVPANADLNERFHFTNVENLPPPPGHSVRANADLNERFHFTNVEALPAPPGHSVPANADLNERFHFTNVENLPPPPGHSVRANADLNERFHFTNVNDLPPPPTRKRSDSEPPSGQRNSSASKKSNEDEKRTFRTESAIVLGHNNDHTPDDDPTSRTVHMISTGVHRQNKEVLHGTTGGLFATGGGTLLRTVHRRYARVRGFIPGVQYSTTTTHSE